MSADQHKINAMRELSKQYPPDWNIPPDLQWFSLNDDTMVRLFNMAALPIGVLRAEREHWNNRMDAIADGTHYMRPSFITGQWATWGPETTQEARDPKASRFSLDRCEAYHMAWWVDVLIKTAS